MNKKERVETKLAHIDEGILLNEQPMYAVLQNMHIFLKTLISL